MDLQKQILIPVDNSPASSQALSYCSLLFSEDPDVHFQLIYCLPQSFEAVFPEPAEPDSSLQPPTQSRTRFTERSEIILNKANDYLRGKGISRSRILTITSASSGDVAASILTESDRLMSDCISIARRGIGYIGEMVLGSVSASLIRNSHSTPLWIIDGDISSKNILVAVDGSIHALRAIDHLAFMLHGRTDVSIFLYHCSLFLAAHTSCRIERFYGEWDRDWCNTYLSGDGCLFNGPRQLLLESGIPADRVITLPELKHLEESSSIIQQANRNNCGTVLIGRRGPDVRKGFFGGVSNRTIRQSQNLAIWIVG